MRIVFTLAVLVFGSVAFAQAPVFKGEPVTPLSMAALDAQFGAYEVYKIDISALNHYVKQAPGARAFRLDLQGGPGWDLEIYAHDIRSQDYTLQAQEEHGIVYYPVSEIKTFRGALAQQPENIASLTFDHEFIYGFIREGDEEWFIEPLWYFIPEAARDLFVVYPASKVIPVEGKTCGVDEMKHRVGQLDKHEPGHTPETGNCYRLELAIASDWSMRQKYGSVPGVESHNIGVMNNVATNYDNEFSDEINFFIVTQYVSNCSTCDPWTSSTDPEVLLDDFTDWGPANFGVTHDLGQLWTNRDFDGGTVGIAWLNAVCTSLRYHCLQDFTTNANLLRVMTAHEIGHNFSAEHDAQGSQFIMAPTVQNTDIWSALSISDMNAFILQIDPPQGCLTLCPPPVPPTPAFTANITNLCAGSFVTFFDESTNLPSSWSWSMPGATPSSSTERSPTVIYNNPGVYNVTLTVTNANGSNSLTKPAYIVVSGSTGTDFFFFEGFENGAGSWTLQNPDNGITWANTSVNGTRQGSKAMVLDNFNYPASGQRDGLISPTFSLFGRNNAVLEIEYAYARFNATRRDSLIVYISTNNGASYTRLFAATETGNGAFATRADLTTPFTPANTSEWCFGTGGPNCLSLNLSAYTGFTNCKIRIENYTGRGNSMFIDNVRILSACELAVPPTANFIGIPTSGCAPLQVAFQDQSTNTPQSWNWSFPGAIPPASTLQNPIVLFPTPGNYSVTLTVTNPAGSNSITKTNYITVGGPPTAQFSYTVDGSTLTVTNQSSPNATSFTWNFGDGTTSNLQNPPPHTYANDGAYVVTLTATNACGTSIFPQTVLIETPPTAGFTASPASGCAPLTVNFTDQSSPNVLSWSWSFPGGAPSSSTEENPIVTYNTPGVYDVQLIVTNTHSSDTLIQNDLITVEPGATAAFTASVSGTVVTFTNNSSNATSYLWDFGDGNTSTETDPVHDYGQNGAFEVVLTAYGDCDTVTVTQTVEPELILQAPEAGLSADNTSGCAPFTVQFTDESTNSPSQWSWTFEGGDPATSTGQNPVVEYLSPGVFDVTLIATNTVGSDTISYTAFITVDAGPSAAFDFSVNGTTASFTNNSSNALSYFWDFGDGSTSTTAAPSHDFATDGEYTVMLIATNDCGPDTATAVVVIVTPPAAGFSADVTEGCAPLTVHFANQSSSNAVSWSWTFEGGAPASSTEENPVVQYLNPGVYGVTLTVSNAAGESTEEIAGYIQVNSGPEAAFSLSANGLTVDFTNASSGATSYFWDFGDGTNSAESDPQHTFPGAGGFDITLVATNDCGSDTTSIFLELLLPPTAGFSADQTEGCAPMTVQFTNESSANAISWSWTFEGGIPASSTEENPVVQYLSPGSYGVTLTVTNAAGEDTESASAFIVVNTGPAASFDVSVAGANAAFSNSSANATSYFWHFGDGATSTESDPAHSYAEDGIYEVMLIAANACGPDTVTTEVVIVTPPVAGFTADDTEGCAPLTVQFTNQSSENVASWLWTFEGGNPASSTLGNPVVQYLNPGTFGVTLTVSNGAGENEISFTDYITVLPDPVASFSTDVNGNVVTFTNSSSNGNTYLWDFGDGTGSTQPNPQHTYTQDGVFTVKLTVFGSCGSSVFTQQVAIATLGPLALFSASPVEGCGPLTVHFNNLSSDNSESFEWFFPGGTPAASTAFNPVVVYNQPGTYDVTLIAYNPNGSDEASQAGMITVLPPPTADFDFTISNGATVLFSNTSSGASAYSWSFGDGASSTLANPAHTYSQIGAFLVELTVEGECGTNMTTQVVGINQVIPTAAFSANPVSGCAPVTVQFSDQTGGNPGAWNWEFPGGEPSSSTEQHPVVTYAQAGQYTVTLQVSNAAGSDVLMQSGMIAVSDVPDPAFTWEALPADPLTISFTNTTTGANSFFWNFGDGQTSTLNSPTHSYDAIGDYTVVFTATNGCGDALVEEVIALVSVREAGLFEKLLIFPNPNKGAFTVLIEAPEAGSKAVQMRLINAIGQQLHWEEAILQDGKSVFHIEQTGLAAGLYWIEIQIGDQRTGRKIVVE
jgi:PKD repeat protein